MLKYNSVFLEKRIDVQYNLMIDGVVIGSKVKEAVENILCDCAPELRELYEKTRWGNGQKWLMIDLEDQGEMFADVLQLIEIRRG